MALHWYTKRFDELTLLEWHDLLRLRIDVFVVEQNCPYPELDGADLSALHVLALNGNDEVVAYARILPPGSDGHPHVGRVVVRMDHRRMNVATQLLERALEVVGDTYGSHRSALAAQSHLEHFYARFGYERVGPDYPLDGIPHVDMVRK